MPTVVAHVAEAVQPDTRRLELILRQVDSLPTLPVVATRLLSLTSRDDSKTEEVVELISSDQALTAKVLSMCRASSVAVRDITTVDRAVVMLGFDTIRNAVLSVKVIEAFGEKKTVASESTPKTLPHTDFWRHCLAVAVAAERIAEAHPQDRELRASEAFVCGLLHDIGKLALDRVLPKAYQRVIELVDLNQSNIAEFERRIVGMDHHTTGKRLAEQWQLPDIISDCIWLHGSPFESVPDLPHRRMVGLITLADLIARTQHIGYSGNFALREDPVELARQLGLDPQRVEEAVADLHEQVGRRAGALGLDDTPSEKSYLLSIQQANQMLGRLNNALVRRTQTGARQSQVIEAITAFHSQTTRGRSIDDVHLHVVHSAIDVFGTGFYGVLYPSRRDSSWLITIYNKSGEVVASNYVDPPIGAPKLTQVDPNHPGALNQMGILPWLADYIGDEVDIRELRLLPLGCGYGTAAVLMHDRSALPPWKLLGALTNTWGAAIASASEHDESRRISEQLADANHALTDAQERLLRNESLARVGEMAAGAAHEMNNPLAVISGRGQLLSQSLLPGSKEHKMAATIVQQSNQLTDLITSLRLYADPPQADRRVTDIAELLDETVKMVQARASRNLQASIYLKVNKDMPTVWIDPKQINFAVSDLLNNAMESLPRSGVNVSARVDMSGNRLIIQVSDDGSGMDEETLGHAMDPFFSAKPAGRNVGMGLPRAHQYVVAHGGTIGLRSMPGEGTVATITIPLDSND